MTTSVLDRNLSGPASISSGVSGAVGLSEGPADPHPHSQRRGSERGTTQDRRGSEPDTRHNLRPCRRCKQPTTPGRFPLADDPAAKAHEWATRWWCDTCLVSQGHLTRAAADRRMTRTLAPVPRYYQPHDDPTPYLGPPTAAQTAEAEARVREHSIMVGLLDAAADDPTYGLALVRAAQAHLVASGLID